jgi:hypothetical protein
MSRLQQLRSNLTKYKTDLQRVYNWEYQSTKLIIGGANLYITDIDHPFFQFENIGDYNGFISSTKKPADMNLTFLENDRSFVSQLLYFWDTLKFNRSTGIHYPKAVYEDQGILTYIGGDTNASTQAKTARKRYYIVKGFYPINRSPISLSYGSNDVLKIQVSFNVDEVEPFETANILSSIIGRAKNKKEAEKD